MTITTPLDEVSSITATLGRDSNVQRLMKDMHKHEAAPHDLKFMPLDKDELDWAAFKKVRGWLLFKCTKGVAAIRRNGNEGKYKLIMSNDAWINDPNEVDPETGVVTTAIEKTRAAIDQAVSVSVQVVNNLIELSSDRKDELLKAILIGVGKIKERYVAKVTDAQRERKARRPGPDPMAGSRGTFSALEKKFRPVFLKSIIQADAELSGVISIVIKAKAYDRATKIVARLKTLSNMARNLERGLSAEMSDSVRYAVGMTAIREFDLTDAGITGWGERVNVDVGSKYLQEILNRAVAGDGKIISEILYYFKRHLMLVR